ncbi:hypothetical protein ACWDXH_12225 [Micromonospora chokoriensis]
MAAAVLLDRSHHGRTYEPTNSEQRISPDVAEVLGRPPRPFADWATRTIAAFR